MEHMAGTDTFVSSILMGTEMSGMRRNAKRSRAIKSRTNSCNCRQSAKLGETADGKSNRIPLQVERDCKRYEENDEAQTSICSIRSV